MHPADRHLALPRVEQPSRRRALGVAAMAAALFLLAGALPVAARDPDDGQVLVPQPPATFKNPLPATDLGPRELRPVELKHAPTAAVTATTTTFTVTTTNDSPPFSGDATECVDSETVPMCSLRAAVEAANNLGSPVDIILPAGTYALDGDAYGKLSIDNAGGTSIIGDAEGAPTISLATGVGSVLTVTHADGHGGMLWLKSLILTGGNADIGGGLNIEYANTGAVLDDVTISGNFAVYGGGVGCGFASSGGSLWIVDSTISGNTAEYYGGGIYENQCGVSISHSHVDDNSTTLVEPYVYGAGLAAQYGTVQLDHVTLNGNTAGVAGVSTGFGGGMYVFYAIVNGRHVTIEGNTSEEWASPSPGAGGGVLVSGGVVELFKSSISDNTAKGTDSAAAGLGIYYDSLVALHATHVDGNVSEWDGESGYCHAGGAIFVAAPGKPNALTLDSGSTLSNNTGGGLHVYASGGSATVKVKDSTVSWNSTRGDGGGGGICAGSADDGSLSIRVKRSHVHHNSASGDYSAGGIFATANGNSEIHLAIKRSSISSNESTGTAGYGGIGVVASATSHAEVDLEDTTVSHNVAGVFGQGGGLFVYGGNGDGPVEASLSDVLISRNQVGTEAGFGRGGGIAGLAATTFRVSHSKINDNTAVGSDGNASSGGGVYLDTQAASSFIKTRINRNAATGGQGYGGGVYTNGHADRFVRSTIAGNSAGFGAGLYADDHAWSLFINRSTISGNSAGDATHAGRGGGVYLNEGGTQIVNSTLANNLAAGLDGQGGAIYQVSGYGLTLDFSTIAGNAAAEGGAYYATSGDNDAVGVIHGSIIANACFSENPPATTLISAGHNVLIEADCVVTLAKGDQVVADAGLKSLARYGGPTKTIKLKKSSPAIHNGGKYCPRVDQRGVHRPSSCDSGAFER